MLVLCLMMTASCDKDYVRNKEFDLWGAYSHQDQIKLDGAYVYRSEDSIIQSFMIPYENGILYYQTFINDDLKNIDQAVLEVESKRDSERFWGAFDIQGDKYRVQLPSPRGGPGDLPIWNYYGAMINDQSIHMIRRVEHSDEDYTFNNVYTYEFLTNKPDSTCDLLEELGAP